MAKLFLILGDNKLSVKKCIHFRAVGCSSSSKEGGCYPRFGTLAPIAKTDYVLLLCTRLLFFVSLFTNLILRMFSSLVNLNEEVNMEQSLLNLLLKGGLHGSLYGHLLELGSADLDMLFSYVVLLEVIHIHWGQSYILEK